MKLSEIRWRLKRLLVFRYQMKRGVRKRLARYYTRDAEGTAASEKIVVCMADGKRRHGGLADRLRSYATYYAFCKEHGVRFAIHATSPFKLEDYLEPNNYDWRLKPGELSYNSSVAHPVILNVGGPRSDFELRSQYKDAVRELVDTRFQQIHLYSNYYFGQDDFGAYFNELFRPAPRIKEALDKCKAEIGGPYIAACTRFLELLGDFKEPKVKFVLGPDDQQRLMAECRRRVEMLHEQYPAHRILVTSDSKRFLDSCRSLPYVYIPRGEIEHVDLRGSHADHTKTFVDFLLISGAERVYQIKIGPMYAGNFSLRAAQAGGVQHTILTG